MSIEWQQDLNNEPQNEIEAEAPDTKTGSVDDGYRDPKDPFEALGVSKDATDEEIKKAYRDMSKIVHPDKHFDNKEEYSRRFRIISEAKDKLINRDEGLSSDSQSGDAPINSGPVVVETPPKVKTRYEQAQDLYKKRCSDYEERCRGNKTGRFSNF